MKRGRRVLLLALAWAAGFPAVAADTARVDVVFVDPKKFTDVRGGYTQTDSARDFFLAEIRRYIEQQAGRRLAGAESLRVTITDVQLAGVYEARRPNITNVRIVREVTPARIDLSFQLLRADGTVLGEGARQLRGTGYPVAVGIDPSDPLLYEKVLLDDWLRTDLPASRAR